jgi:hypothetical protein
MIDLQSSAITSWPCPSRAFENSQQHARVIYGWVHRPTKSQSPTGTTEVLLNLLDIKYRIRVYRCPSVVKFAVFESKIIKPLRGCAKLCQHVQDPREGGAGLSNPTANFSLARCESTQINPSMTKYRPHTGLYRPKTPAKNEPLLLLATRQTPSPKPSLDIAPRHVKFPVYGFTTHQ